MDFGGKYFHRENITYGGKYDRKNSLPGKHREMASFYENKQKRRIEKNHRNAHGQKWENMLSKIILTLVLECPSFLANIANI